VARVLIFDGLLFNDDLGHQTFRFIQTAFGSVKLSIAAVPCSQPRPESRSPPHGKSTFSILQPGGSDHPIGRYLH